MIHMTSLDLYIRPNTKLDYFLHSFLKIRTFCLMLEIRNDECYQQGTYCYKMVTSIDMLLKEPEI